MSDAKVTFAGDAASLLAEHKKIEDAKNKEIAGLKALLAESKKTYSEEQKHLREKQAALDKTRTAQQVYNDQMQKWFNLMATGKITLAEFNRLKGVETKALNDASAAISKENKERNLAISAKRTDAIASRGSMTATMSMTTAFGAAAGVIATATTAMRAFSEEQKRIQEEASGTVTSVDTLARKYAVQAGLKPEEMRGNRDAILEIAKENAVTPEEAFAAATQLSGSGFADPVKSGTLDSFLKIMATSNLKGGDQKQYVLAMSRFMGGYGDESSAENLLDLGVRMRGLFKETNVEVSDLSEFAKAAPAFKASNVSKDDALALMTTLVQGMPSAAEAATGGRNIVSILAASKATRSGEEALDMMGLKPEQVDMIGETLPVALGRLKTAVNAMPETDRIGALTKLFGRENTAAAMVAMEGLDKMPKWIDAQKDTAGFVAGVEMSQSGEAARKQREAITVQQQQLRNEDITSQRDYIKESENRKYVQMVADIESSGLSPIQKRAAKATLMAGRAAKGLVMSVNGMNPEDMMSEEGRANAVKGYYGAMNQSFTEDELKKRMAPAADPQAAAMARQNQLLEDIAGNQQRVAEAVTNPANKPVVNPNATGRTDK